VKDREREGEERDTMFIYQHFRLHAYTLTIKTVILV